MMLLYAYTFHSNAPNAFNTRDVNSQSQKPGESKSGWLCTPFKSKYNQQKHTANKQHVFWFYERPGFRSITKN